MIETLQTIIADLNSNTAINNILGWRISIWQPVDTPTQIYLTITIISETQNIDVNKRDRVEFRFLWWNEKCNAWTKRQIPNRIKIKINLSSSNECNEWMIWFIFIFNKKITCHPKCNRRI